MTSQSRRDVALARVATVAEQMRRRAETAETEVTRLREALEEIAHGTTGRWSADVAREALYLFTETEADDPPSGSG